MFDKIAIIAADKIPNYTIEHLLSFMVLKKN